MQHRILLLLAFLCSLITQAQNFEEFQTTQANIRLSATNAGTFGNAFRGYKDGSGTPSLEYPAGSGIEHLFEGGIWIGGTSNGVIRVSTSAYDSRRDMRQAAVVSNSIQCLECR
jgi:transcription elongation factor